MRAERVGQETLLSQIVAMVASAQRSRAPIQRLADKISGYFVPVVIAIAALTFVCWAVFGPEPRFAYALVNAVAVGSDRLLRFFPSFCSDIHVVAQKSNI